ncbi:hypothetical protein [Shewanella youngdeokensis]|uniref:Sulfotransferase domain-containing protein n=1 Tax=Shewanella youngdeokensis TaxID=2999068 RepID=A0ABZ0K1J6_9GAMM|nr:hypothetical protein RGE70_05820 [Shewanella sp. DAU334]
MDKMRLIIHGGMHKTGSTALQEALSSHNELNQLQGVLFPNTGIRHDYGVGSRHFYVRETLFNTHHKQDNVWEGLYQEAISKNCNVIILSYENFLSPGIMDEGAINEIKYYFDVSFICYIRDSISYFNAKYKEWVRRLAFEGEAADFVLEHLKYVHIDKMLKPWIDLCGLENVFCFPFRRESFFNQSIVDDFGSVLSSRFNVNIKLDKFTSRVSNSSYNNAQTLLCLLRNKFFGGFKAMSNSERAIFSKIIDKLDSEAGLLLSKSTCIQLKSMSWRSNHFLRHKFNCIIEEPIVKDLPFCRDYHSPYLRVNLINEIERGLNRKPNALV